MNFLPVGRLCEMPHATTNCDSFEDFTALHKAQLSNLNIPEIYWEVLFNKMKNEIYDAGEKFTMLRVQGEPLDDIYDDDVQDGENDDIYTWRVSVASKGGIKASRPESIYLVHHAWTYTLDKARNQLETIPGLLSRISALMEIKTAGRTNEAITFDVLHEMWRFNQTYTISGQSEMPVWYVMDEFGCRIQHSENPSFKAVPFFYFPRQLAYTVIWPLRDLCEGEEVTRNYISGNEDMLLRKIRLLPWQPEDMTHLVYGQHDENEDLFMKYTICETLPNLDLELGILPHDRNLIIYSDKDYVKKYLTDNRFEKTSDIDQADILWLEYYLADFGLFSEENPNCLISQFPCESVMTERDLLTMVSRRAAGVDSAGALDSQPLDSYNPKWWMSTYSLTSELSKFVSFFQHCELRGIENYWLVKPYWNWRVMDTHVTNNLSCILRLLETGPKRAIKYIEKPVLVAREGVGMAKFDMTFYVMLHSVNPLQYSVHDKFSVNMATKSFSLDNFEDMRKHLTTFKTVDLDNKVLCEDFLDMFESQYPHYPWNSVQSSVFGVMRELFEAACSKPPPKGIGESPQSRVIYGMTFTLKWDTNLQGEKYIQPILENVEGLPDLCFMCDAYPDFINDCFAALFLQDYESGNVQLL